MTDTPVTSFRCSKTGCRSPQEFNVRLKPQATSMVWCGSCKTGYEITANPNGIMQVNELLRESNGKR